MSKIICQCGDVIQPDDDALCGTCALDFHANKRAIESLKREIAALKEESASLKSEILLLASAMEEVGNDLIAMAQKPLHQYEDALRKEIAQLRAENRSLVEQVNQTFKQGVLILIAAMCIIAAVFLSALDKSMHSIGLIWGAIIVLIINFAFSIYGGKDE